jgi:hypothetical protein
MSGAFFDVAVKLVQQYPGSRVVLAQRVADDIALAFIKHALGMPKV